ncbi:MAG: hypothetical protein IT162_23620 [Bryobacterales bacterium]|nr:hypothetical protein [Bryobacterales bacterium]
MNMLHTDDPRSGFSLGHESLNLLHGEDAEAFRGLLLALEETLQPAGELEHQQVDLLAHHYWRLLRAAELELAVFDVTMNDSGQPVFSNGAEAVARYQARLLRSYYQTLDCLRKLQAEREKAGRGRG